MAKLFVKYNDATGKDEIENLIFDDFNVSLQDALKDMVASIFSDTNSIVWTYNSQTKTFTADVQTVADGGLEVTTGGLQIKLDDLLSMLRGRACCHIDESWELISTGTNNKISLDVPPSGLMIHGDQCYYFKIKIEGEWSRHAADNDASVDFTSNPIWVQFLTKVNTAAPWTKSRSKRFDYSVGDTIAFNEEFIFTSDSDLIIAPNLSRYDDATLIDIINPILNWSRFWMRITVTKCPKTSWFNIYSIPPDGPNGTAVKTGFLPAPADEGLPFNGWYEVHSRVKVAEEVAVGSTPSNLNASQTFELRGVNGAWLEVDSSIRYQGVVPPNDDKAMNFSLQGSAYLYVNHLVTGSRDIEYKVTLPNGAYKTLVDGYAHIKYHGPTLSINAKD